MSDQERLNRIFELAGEQWLSESIDIDAASEESVSEGDENGAYVRAWVWVSFEGTELEKEPAS